MLETFKFRDISAIISVNLGSYLKTFSCQELSVSLSLSCALQKETITDIAELFLTYVELVLSDVQLVKTKEK